MLHEREATKNQDFFTIRRLFELQFIKKSNKIPKFFLNVRIKDQLDYQIIAKDQ